METSRDSDALLVERIRAGDDRALAAVYDQHGGLVYGLARRVARDEQIASDVTQEVFTYLWEMPHRVDLSNGSLRSYLALVAHRRVVEEVRRRRADTAAAPEAKHGPETRGFQSAALTWGKKGPSALDMLPAEERAAVELAYYDGLTYVQVARALGIPGETVKARLCTALTSLRTLLTDEAR